MKYLGSNLIFTYLMIATSAIGWWPFGDYTCDKLIVTIPLDYKTDSVIQRSLRTQLGPDTTVITIAHRLQTIMDADRIVRYDFLVNFFHIKSRFTDGSGYRTYRNAFLFQIKEKSTASDLCFRSNLIHPRSFCKNLTECSRRLSTEVGISLHSTSFMKAPRNFEGSRLIPAVCEKSLLVYLI